MPTSTVMPAPPVMAIENLSKKEAEALKKKVRNQQARARAKQKKDSLSAPKGSEEIPLTGSISTPFTSTTPMSTTSLSAPTSTASSIGSASTVKTKTAEKVEVDKSKKKKTPVSRSNSLSSITKKPQVAREPSNLLMEMIDHATLIDVKNLPSIFNSNAYKLDVNLDEEQRVLLYGDEEGQAKMKDITMAAAAALDASVDVEARDNLFREAGVPPLPTTIPAIYDGWGTKNVVSGEY
jgi:hypothetical protein